MAIPRQRTSSETFANDKWCGTEILDVRTTYHQTTSSDQVRRSVENVFPNPPPDQQSRGVIGSEGHNPQSSLTGQMRRFSSEGTLHLNAPKVTRTALPGPGNVNIIPNHQVRRYSNWGFQHTGGHQHSADDAWSVGERDTTGSQRRHHHQQVRSCVARQSASSDSSQSVVPLVAEHVFLWATVGYRRSFNLRLTTL